MANADSVADAVLSFLDVAADLYEVAVAIHTHRTQALVNCDVPRLSAVLAAAVERLRAATTSTQHGPDGIDGLGRSCAKLGLDLLVRLDRVHGFQKAHDTGADLRAAWPVAAVEALADRIDTMQQGLSVLT